MLLQQMRRGRSRGCRRFGGTRSHRRGHLSGRAVTLVALIRCQVNRPSL